MFQTERCCIHRLKLIIVFQFSLFRQERYQYFFCHFKLTFFRLEIFCQKKKKKKIKTNQMFRLLQRFQKTYSLHGLQVFREKSEKE